MINISHKVWFVQSDGNGEVLSGRGRWHIAEQTFGSINALESHQARLGSAHDLHGCRRQWPADEAIVRRIASQHHTVSVRDREHGSREERFGLLELAEVLAQPVEVESADE